MLEFTAGVCYGIVAMAWGDILNQYPANALGWRGFRRMLAVLLWPVGLPVALVLLRIKEARGETPREP